MKVTFYGSIALAAIAADSANAVNLDDDLAITEYAQAEMAPMEAEQETALATIDTEAAGHSDAELDSWSDLSSEADLDNEIDVDADSLSDSDLSGDDEDFDLAQTNADCEVDADAERCPC